MKFSQMPLQTQEIQGCRALRLVQNPDQSAGLDITLCLKGQEQIAVLELGSLDRAIA